MWAGVADIEVVGYVNLYVIVIVKEIGVGVVVAMEAAEE
jgi:hypothetical protein